MSFALILCFSVFEEAMTEIEYFHVFGNCWSLISREASFNSCGASWQYCMPEALPCDDGWNGSRKVSERRLPVRIEARGTSRLQQNWMHRIKNIVRCSLQFQVGVSIRYNDQLYTHSPCIPTVTCWLRKRCCRLLGYWTMANWPSSTAGC